MDLFTYLMAKNDHNTSVNRDLFSYLLGKGQSGTYQTFTGTSISANNTKKGKMKLSLKGNTSQYSTTGKNLENSTGLTTSTTSGIVFTPIYSNNGELEYINVNGTATDNCAYAIPNKAYLDSSKSYIVNGCPSGGSANSYRLTYYNYDTNSAYIYGGNDTGSGETMNVSQTDYSFTRLTINIKSGTTCSNLKFYPMIRLSTETDTYEPYTGGQPSPSPSYPQQIHEVSGDNEIVVRGKQLFDGELELGIYDGTTGQPVANSNYMRSKNYIVVDELTDYSITSIDISNVNIAVYEYKEDYSFNLSTNKIIYAGNTLLTTNSGTKYIKFRPMVENNNLSSRFMLNKGSTPSPYEPYQSQSKPLNLGDKEICKIGNYEDKIFKAIKGNEIYDSLSVEEKNTLDYGKWYLRKNIGKDTLVGSETEDWRMQNNKTNSIYVQRGYKVYSKLPSGNVANAFCNYFSATSTTQIFDSDIQGITFSIDGYLRLNILKSIATDISALKTWLSTHNTIVYYPLETPTNELFNDTIQEQIEDIYNATMSYEGQTNISQVNNDLAFEIEAEIKVGS